MTVTYTVGDTREVIATIADGSVDLIASSPPFLALRSYLPAGHEAKGDEIGSERNPAEFIDMLLGLTAEWGRVLAPHGSIAIELGDTYAGTYSPIAASPMTGPRPMPGSDRSGTHWPRAKSLALIPQLYAVALAYGINPLTGQPSPAGRWLVRNVIVWHRPNPAVGALGDKVRPSTSYIVIATRSPKRWFDLTAVRTPANGRAEASRDPEAKRGQRDGSWQTLGPYDPSQTAGAPPLDAWFDEYDGSHDTWTLTTQPSSLAHYAMWPAKLAERLVLMMCPREVCRVCGEPRRRMEGVAEYVNNAGGPINYDMSAFPRLQTGVKQFATNGDNSAHRNAPTLGWTDCGCEDYERLATPDEVDNGCELGIAYDSRYRPGLTLDPFAGTGTILAVADLHGRDAIGIDIDARNKEIYPRRYDEVKKVLYGTPAPDPAQGVLL